MKIIERLKKMIEKDTEEEEEILQTKIVSPKEVLAEWEKWIPPASSEIDSLIIEKSALKPVEEDMVKQLVKEAENRGLRVEVIPSKVVYTKEPGLKGGKRKR